MKIQGKTVHNYLWILTILFISLFCGGQADAADNAVAHMLRNFHHAGFTAVVDGECILDHRKLSRECHINDRS